MASDYDGALNRPFSAQQLKQEALEYPYSNYRSLQTWLRAASRLRTQARLYEREKDMQFAFIYLYRHTDLILHKIPRHPDYSDPAFRYDLREAREDVRENIPKLERWKPKLNQIYRDYRLAAELEFREETQVSEDDDDDEFQADHERRLSNRERFSPGPERSKAEQQRQVEQSSFRRDRFPVERERRFSSREPSSASRDHLRSEQDRQRSIREPSSARRDYREVEQERRLSARQPSSPRRDDRYNQSASTASHYLTPRDSRRHSSPAAESSRRTIYRYPSPQRRHSQLSPRTNHSPPPPFSLTSCRPSLSPHPRPRPRPTSSPTPIHLPTTLIPLFLAAAHTNTAHQIETCALLCGYLSPTPTLTWHITTLLLFNQTGTSTTCTETTSGALQIHSSLQANGLAVCGWIHTHPKHSCFLSSIDLHTQAWWQVENASAVAVVVDPFEVEKARTRGWDVYRLTSVGMDVVKGCEVRPGEFHTHKGWDREDLYESAMGEGGHCLLVEGAECVVDDRREDA